MRVFCFCNNYNLRTVEDTLAAKGKVMTAQWGAEQRELGTTGSVKKTNKTRLTGKITFPVL